MAQQLETRKLSEEELFFFEDQICGEADAVFRFCVALTLSQEHAIKLLRLGFRKASANIRSLLKLSGSDLRVALLSYVYAEAKDNAAASTGDSPLFRFLKKMPPANRAILAAREVCGLNTQQIMQVVAMSENDVVRTCAEARKDLRQHMSQVN